jgi:peptidyl-prolyl cis-trans isomerase SurA
MKNRFLDLVFVACTAAAVVAQTAPNPQPMFTATTVKATGKPIARINGTVLTDRDLLREMMTIFPYARQHGGKFPESMESDIRRGALDMIEFEELVYQEAARRDFKVSSARLELAMKVFRQQFASAEEFRGYLKEECGGSSLSLREKVRRSLMIEDLLQVEVSQKASVTETEIKQLYQKSPGRFYSAESISLQTISLVIPEDATAQQEASVRKRAEDALRQAKKTKTYEEFGMLAEKISQDDWRVMMGDHKFITREQMPPEVAKIAFTMHPGQLSELIRADNSWCIVRVNGRQDPHWTGYEEVKASLRKEMEANKVETLRRALHQQLRKKAKVEEL